ncbi:hypothetical protein AB0383_16430 [Amycolatopsis sp. NPDC051373]|uniref:hypothetical protein n=1 Tax=Amycolatopsis sp. NPDC051373 TaxID=3155801 RepID=UPI003450B002
MVTGEDRAASRQFTEIMHAVFDLGEALADTSRLLDEGLAARTYWVEAPRKTVTRLRCDSAGGER